MTRPAPIARPMWRGSIYIHQMDTDHHRLADYAPPMRNPSTWGRISDALHERRLPPSERGRLDYSLCRAAVISVLFATATALFAAAFK